MLDLYFLPKNTQYKQENAEWNNVFDILNNKVITDC